MCLEVEDRFIQEEPPSDRDECSLFAWEKCIPHSNAMPQCLMNIQQPFSFVATRYLFHINARRVKTFQASYAMLYCLMFHRMFWYALLLLNSVARISAAQDACVYRSGAMLVESVVVVKHTIHIITSIPHNTTFKVNTGLTITVDNAPTSLDLLTTYFSRSTAIETMNGSVIPFIEL